MDLEKTCEVVDGFMCNQCNGTIQEPDIAEDLVRQLLLPACGETTQMKVFDLATCSQLIHT